MGALQYNQADRPGAQDLQVPADPTTLGPSGVAPYILSLMQRNIGTVGYQIEDPQNPGTFSAPGCVIASPSYVGYPGNVAVTDQNYVYNWTRDAALTMMEVASAPASFPDQALSDLLGNYVNFAATCQSSGADNGLGRWTVRGAPTAWSDQTDGPALRVLTLLQSCPLLSGQAATAAAQVIATDLAYLLARYTGTTVSHWEDAQGDSLFARAAQLKCFTEIAANTLGLPVPTGTTDAITWLTDAVPAHWDAAANCYISLLGRQMLDPNIPVPQYDPSIDPIMACLYGAGISCDDPKLLSTAFLVRQQWETGPGAYPINGADKERGIGPLMGRYLGDGYDGDDLDNQTGHPWALCTCNFAQLYYSLATSITTSGTVPSGLLTDEFFAQVQVTEPSNTKPSVVADALVAAGDSMMNAVIFHSNQLELSEQFDQNTGYEKSVADLTWSYASFLSAARARPS